MKDIYDYLLRTDEMKTSVMTVGIEQTSMVLGMVNIFFSMYINIENCYPLCQPLSYLVCSLFEGHAD